MRSWIQQHEGWTIFYIAAVAELVLIHECVLRNTYTDEICTRGVFFYFVCVCVAQKSRESFCVLKYRETKNLRSMFIWTSWYISLTAQYWRGCKQGWAVSWYKSIAIVSQRYYWVSVFLYRDAFFEKCICVSVVKDFYDVPIISRYYAGISLSFESETITRVCKGEGTLFLCWAK